MSTVSFLTTPAMAGRCPSTTRGRGPWLLARHRSGRGPGDGPDRRRRRRPGGLRRLARVGHLALRRLRGPGAASATFEYDPRTGSFVASGIVDVSQFVFTPDGRILGAGLAGRSASTRAVRRSGRELPTGARRCVVRAGEPRRAARAGDVERPTGTCSTWSRSSHGVTRSRPRRRREWSRLAASRRRSSAHQHPRRRRLRDLRPAAMVKALCALAGRNPNSTSGRPTSAARRRTPRSVRLPDSGRAGRPDVLRLSDGLGGATHHSRGEHGGAWPHAFEQVADLLDLGDRLDDHLFAAGAQVPQPDPGLVDRFGDVTVMGMVPSSV